MLDLLASAVPSLTAPESGAGHPAWLHSASEWNLPLADRIAEQARQDGLDWQLADGVDVPFATVGRRARERWLREPSAPSLLAGAAPSRQLAETGLTSIDALFGWRDPTLPVETAEVLQLSADSRRSPADIAERLTVLGYDVEPLLGAPRHDSPMYGCCGSWARTAGCPPGATLSAAQVCVSAARADCATSQAAQRLRELGFSVPADVPVREHWDKEERAILTRLWDTHAEGPSPEDAAYVSAARVTMVAHRADLPVRRVTGLLGQLGFRLPPGAAELSELTDDDKALLANSHKLSVERDVPLHYVATASRRLKRPARLLAERLRELGFTVAEVPEDEDLPSREEITFLGTDTENADAGHPLSLEQVAAAARRANVSLAEAVDRLARIGHRFSFAPEAVTCLREQDASYVYFSRQTANSDRVSPEAVRAAAHRTNRSCDGIAAALTALGYDVVPPTEEWTRERELEDSLVEALQAPDRHPIPLGPDDSRQISLVPLAVAAMRAGTSLRVAAAMATELGMRHEAETWFETPGPAPTRPAGPSGVAGPPG
ncbi:hypothetical protein AB0L75_08045 [Streptomyces sp. NPDC052101]|uniref:wHTH domain-containing protein n=1 Tax=Streptomyces sp. NPDC052101 TaxID=3155763 RepID=UPI00343E09A3